MATPLELTQMVKVLQAEVTSLRDRVGRLEAKEVTRQMADNEALQSKPVMPQAPEKTDRKMCPKCGVKPAYFFHVKNCAGKQKEHCDDGNRASGAT